MKNNNKYQWENLQNSALLRFISILSIACLIYYLWWRITETLNPEALVFSWVLVLAEAFGVFNYVLFAWITQDVSPPRPFKHPKSGMSVDVFVPTYDESLEILEATLIGCKNIRYPHKTYVLDDGKREEVRQLAKCLGCRYITRPANENAKAGNINHALTKTDGDFIVVLDADMVPQPDYLDRTLGYFEDNEKLAFIQLPQEFYNQDSIQHDRQVHRWHEQSLFFRVIQPGKNKTNSSFWCGSPSILRREALMDVGGVATETITEDIHTSVRFHSRGWSSLFVNEVLAYGIAPQTIKAFLLQRLRWAQGTMQLYRSSESPIWVSGLSLKQRLSYVSSFLAYFESFQKLILIFTPVYIILFNVFPMDVRPLAFIQHWIPYFIIAVFANKVGGRGIFRYYQTEKYNLLKMVVFIQSSLTLIWKKPLKFNVTPKSVSGSVYRDERRALRSYMAILGLITGALIFGLIKLLTRNSSVLLLGIESYLIAYFWTSYNAILIFLGIYEVLRKRHERKQYRFAVKTQGELYDKKWLHPVSKVELKDISVTGVNFLTDTLLHDGKKLLLHFRNLQKQSILLPLKIIHHQRRDLLNRIHLGVSFDELRGAHRERLFSFLFVDMPRMQSYDLPQPEVASLSSIRKQALRLQLPIPRQLQFREKLRQFAQISYLSLEAVLGYLLILRHSK